MNISAGVVPALASALESRGYDKLTAVQAAVLNPDLMTSDLLVSAQTGSGKTVAFGMAMGADNTEEAWEVMWGNPDYRVGDIVQEAANGPPLMSEDMPQTVMVEDYVKGRELTVTVLGDMALTVTDIITDGWYDYHAKYAEGGSRHELPADIPRGIFDACLDYAKRAHDVCYAIHADTD